MTRTRKGLSIVLGFVLIVCITVAGILLYRNNGSNKSVVESDVSYDEVQNALAEYMNSNADVLGDKRDQSNSGVPGREIGVLTQRVTILKDGEIMPISGTVTKNQDGFYPGTYEIKFSTKAILTSRATVMVDVDIAPGEKVYVLIGDKDKGYTEFTEVVAGEDSMITFDTNIIQNYTISTTDIESAQKAMANLVDESLN